MAQFLIDTHILIWYLEDDPQLSPHVAELLEDTRHNLYVSIASLWEIAIKSGLGKLKLKIEFYDLKEVLKRLSIEILSIDVEDTQTYLALPLFENHRDPFDRILVAQVMRRWSTTDQRSSMSLVSGDKKFDLYEIHRVWK
jgi:PIN domain nuclease of toxin-antitoxin system